MLKIGTFYLSIQNLFSKRSEAVRYVASALLQSKQFVLMVLDLETLETTQ